MKIGKRIGSVLYVHISSIEYLTEELRDFYNNCLNKNEITDEFNVIKIDFKNAKLSLLLYDDFFDDPFPSLSHSILINCKDKTSKFRSYKDNSNKHILHRKELLLHEEHTNYFKYKVLTQQAEIFGLFEHKSKIGFKNYWDELLKKKGLFFDENKYEFKKENAVDRHKTALTRYSYSLPLKLTLSHKMIKKEFSIFDYGCGKGSDLQLLKEDGYIACGFDAHYLPNAQKINSDIVNLGYVINVIEDVSERIYVLKDAYKLAKKLLVVSVMLEAQKNHVASTPVGDGFLTRNNTFQKYYNQYEIKTFIDDTLDSHSIPINQGIFFVFKDLKLQDEFLLNKFKNHTIDEIIFENRLPKIKKFSQREKRFKRVENEMQTLWNAVLTQARPLDENEIDEELLELLLSEYNSLKRVYTTLFANFDIDAFEKIKELKRDDLIVFLSLTQFENKTLFKDHNNSLQKDIKVYFGSYKNAKHIGKENLFNISSDYLIISAAKESMENGYGYIHDEHSFMFHRDILDKLPPILRIYVYSATFLYGAIDDVDIFKIHFQSDKLTLLYYDDFTRLTPQLIRRVKVNLANQNIYYFNYEDWEDKQIIYLKSYYMDKTNSNYVKQKLFDENLEEHNLFPFTDRGVSRKEFYVKYNAL